MKIIFCLTLLIVHTSLFAQSCDSSTVKLQVLGSGGPELTANRASSSYLIWIDNKAVALLDAGGGSALRFGQSHANISDLKVVLFSHFHVDHSADFPALIKASWFTNRDKDLPVFGPYGNDFMPSAQQYLQRNFGKDNGTYQYLSDMYDDEQANSAYRLIAHTIENKPQPQKIYQDSQLTITAIKVQHGPIPAIAYVINACGKTIVYSGDTNSQGFENLNQAKTDIFIAHNAIPENAGQIAQSLHMTPSQIGKLAKHLNTEHLILSHRMKRSLGKEKDTLKWIKINYENKVNFADDLDCIIY